MQKKKLTLVIVSLLVVVLSVSLAWFTTQIIGKGKDVSVTSTNLQIVFTDTDGEIAGADIEPGWTAIKTFTVENNSKSEYKYNIVIKDLVNTFVTNGYLQYKITSTNSGYNMTEFKDIPKSQTATDKVLAYSVAIPAGVTQTYTIEFTYPNDEDVDQGDDMGKVLKGTLFITEGTEEPVLLYNQILSDRGIATTNRTTFDAAFDSKDQVLYTAKEDNKIVYYFAGNVTTNWVKFGKNENNQDLYWRIIRTNSDGGVRLLYHGTSTTATDAYIGESEFNSSYGDIASVSYMYGSLGSIPNARTNQTNPSPIKTTIDNWYTRNLEAKGYTKYLSTTAVYCNDRTYIVSGRETYFGAYTRLNTNKTPSYDCSATEDKFTVDSSAGNGKLTHPIALMTADEVSFAGGLAGKYNANAWYFRNAKEGTLTTNSSSTDASYSSTGSTYWWLLSPYYWSGGGAVVFNVYGSSNPGGLGAYNVNDASGVRPAVSLKSCVKTSGGDGSASNPYTIEETTSTSGC